MDPLPSNKSFIIVFINGSEVDDNIYNYASNWSNSGKVILTYVRTVGDIIEIKWTTPVGG